MALRLVKELVSKNPLLVFSKTYCPFCQNVDAIFRDLKADAKFIQLDQREDGSQIQDALQEITGGKTVPKVFIAGQCIGGSDDTTKLYSSGKLQDLLRKAGIRCKL